MELEEEILDAYYNYFVKEKLTNKEFKTLIRYTGVGASQINSYLLGHIGLEEKEKKKIDSEITNLRLAINKFRTPVPLTVYHGTTSMILNNDIVSNYVWTHSSININAFLSTSLSKNIASLFAFPLSEAIILEINLPKGYPLFWMQSLSLSKPEKEILLPNNIKLDIIDYNQEFINKKSCQKIKVIAR